MLLLVLALSGFVVAQSSEIQADFNIGSEEVGADYIPSTSFWDVYGSYVAGAIIVLIVLIIFFKRNRGKVSVKKVKKVKRRKSRKRK